MKCFSTGGGYASGIKIFLLLGILLVFSSAVWADIPKQINFQGVLRDSLGNPYPDGNYSLTFTIYNTASGGTIFWQEVQTISLSGGLFTTLLGSVRAIPESAFTDSLRWLGIEVGSNPEITPRRQLVSVPYSYVADFAQNADKLGGASESNFVRRTGPDSIVSNSGTAFLGKVSGSSTNSVYGIQGFAKNTSMRDAYGGYFTTDSSGTGTHFGVLGYGKNSSPSAAYGVQGSASNTSTGVAFGGNFNTFGFGTGTHYGVYGSAAGTSSAATYGFFGNATNTSTGIAYGGYFQASASGTGAHYGVYGVETAGGSGAAVYAAGDFAGSGAKYAVAKTSQGHRLLSVMESPEVWFEDLGEGELVNGKAHIELDPLFLETVTINVSNPMKVFIQLKDDCKGTYVKTYNTGFDVVELQGGTNNASFSYRIVAKRKGYENQRLKATDIGMDDPNLYPELWQEIEERHKETKVQPELPK